MINLKINQTAYSRSGKQKTASFLSALDEKIESPAQQTTQTLKKGLLQKMFV